MASVENCSCQNISPITIAAVVSSTPRLADSDLRIVRRFDGVFIYRPTVLANLISQLFDKIEERAWIDWLSHVLIEAGIQRTSAVIKHGIACDGNHGHRLITGK